MITVFTSTYNRAYTLRRLWGSLCIQTDDDFEWVIVDDGSSDETELLINEFIAESKVKIRYLKQKNGGKHRAINRGVEVALGELFFIVDSDDYLAPDAIEIIRNEYTEIKDNPKFGGLSGLKAYTNGEKVGGEETWQTIDCNSIELRYKYKVKGDMAEIMRTEVFKEFPFPEIEGEKFCPEALVWNRIASKYIIRHFYKKIYYCEYLPDGLTSKIIKIRMQSPVASNMYYSELYSAPIPILQKIKAAINYWRFTPPPLSRKNLSLIWAMPFGLLMHLNDVRVTHRIF